MTENPIYYCISCAVFFNQCFIFVFNKLAFSKILI